MIKIESLAQIQEILDKPKKYKLYVRHMEKYFNMTLAQLQKKHLSTIQSNIQQSQLYYEIL